MIILYAQENSILDFVKGTIWLCMSLQYVLVNVHSYLEHSQLWFSQVYMTS